MVMSLSMIEKLHYTFRLEKFDIDGDLEILFQEKGIPVPKLLDA